MTKSTNLHGYAPGHSGCPGCGPSISLIQLCDALGKDIVIVNATGCMEINSTAWPNSAWRVPYIHSLFDNPPAVASGVAQALRAQGNDHTVVVALGGDGSFYDISFGALSAMFERGEDVMAVCYNNEAYANTGTQRSGATPLHANTTTTPFGKVLHGKMQPQKKLPEIAAAHGIPYVATASIGLMADLKRKLQKAAKIRGPRFLDVHAPCVLNGGFDGGQTLEVARLALDTHAWPLFEVENGKWAISYSPAQQKPIAEYLKVQGRFRGLSDADVAEVQKAVDERWERISRQAKG